MIGVFSKNKGMKAVKIIGLISGLLVLLIMVSLLIFMKDKDLDDIVGSVFFCIFGGLEAVACGILLYRDTKAFIRVDEERIVAYCQMGRFLDCQIDTVKDIRFMPNGMHIILSNGKRYILSNLQNGLQIQEYIFRRLPKEEVLPLDKETTIAQLVHLKKCQKPEIAIAVCAILLVIPIILLTAWQTGWKELHAFESRDWLLLGIMGITIVVLFAVFTIALWRGTRHSEQYRALASSLYQQVLRTSPPGPGNIIRMYVDEERYASIRVSVYGYPNADDVYCTVEIVDAAFEIQCLHTSEVFPNMQALMESLGEDLTEIPIP